MKGFVHAGRTPASGRGVAACPTKPRRRGPRAGRRDRVRRLHLAAGRGGDERAEHQGRRRQRRRERVAWTTWGLPGDRRTPPGRRRSGRPYTRRDRLPAGATAGASPWTWPALALLAGRARSARLRSALPMPEPSPQPARLLSVNVGRPRARRHRTAHRPHRDLEAPRRRARRGAGREPRRRRPGRPHGARRARQGGLRVRPRRDPRVGGRAGPPPRPGGVRREPHGRGPGRVGRAARRALEDRDDAARGRPAPAAVLQARPADAGPEVRQALRRGLAARRLPADREEGELGAGDRVEVDVDALPDHAVTVRLVSDAILPDHGLIPQVLEAPQLLPSLREWLSGRRDAGAPG